MKAVRAVVGEFIPVSVTITFETQEEIDLIYNTYAVTELLALEGSVNSDCKQAVNSLLGNLSGVLCDSVSTE